MREHTSSNTRLHCLSLISALVLTACGGGGGGSDNNTSAPPAAPVNASPGGIWLGRDPIGGGDLLGVVSETGEGHFIRLTDDAQYVGTVTTSGNNISGSYQGFAPFGFTFIDGSTSGNGSLSGTIQQRQQISATFNFTTSRGRSDQGSTTLTYQTLYDLDSSLSLVAGNYRDPDDGSTINVNSSGVIFSQSALTGCIINGQISIIDSRYNAYRVSYTFSGCLGTASSLNGTTARGLGVFDNTGTNPVVIIGVVNASAGYVLTGLYPKI
jgi:hypothetical protein